MASRSYPPNDGIRWAKTSFIDDAPGSHVGLPEGQETPYHQNFSRTWHASVRAGYAMLPNVGISRSLPCGRLHTPDSAGRQLRTDPDANLCTSRARKTPEIQGNALMNITLW